MLIKLGLVEILPSCSAGGGDSSPKSALLPTGGVFVSNHVYSCLPEFNFLKI